MSVSSGISAYIKTAESSVMDGGIVPGSRRRRKHVALIEKVLSEDGKGGKGPQMDTHKVLYQAMKARYPDALEHTSIHMGEFNPRVAYDRDWENPRGSAIQKGLSRVLRLSDKFGDSARYESVGPFYDPGADIVYAPWNAPGASMHEMGHAVDMNTSLFSGKAPKGFIERQVRGVPRDLYNASYRVFPMWHEHEAWRVGRKGLLQGAAMSNIPWSKVEPIIRDASHSKAPALGSYWGGSIGTGLGIAGAVALDKKMNGIDPRVAAGIVALGSFGGLATGVGVGVLLRNRLKKRYVEKAKREFEGYQRTMGPGKKAAAAGPSVSRMLAARLGS